MKLNELGASNSPKQLAKVFESYFGKKLRFENLTRPQTRTMLTGVRTLISEHRQSPGFHTSQKNPSYLKLIMLEQALTSKLRETGEAGVLPILADPKAAADSTKKAIATVKDPKMKAALDKSAKGATLHPDESKLVAGAALSKTESRLRNLYNVLNESEIQQAQVVLAAQDMVDRMQKMLEDVINVQFKDLPALVDQIKNEVGMEQSTQFNTDASSALTGLVQNLQSAKQAMEAALGVVTGQAPVDPAGGLDVDSQLDGNLGMDGASALDDPLAADAETDAAIPKPTMADKLGRARR